MSETYDKLNHWYGWNGGECPVHPETEVEVCFAAQKPIGGAFARNWEWGHAGIPDEDIIAFRILKLYVAPRKPREWWINIDASGFKSVWNSKAFADDARPIDRVQCVHVREVLPEDEA